MKGIGVSTEDFPLLNGVEKNGERERSCRADKRELYRVCPSSERGRDVERERCGEGAVGYSVLNIE